MFEVGGTFEDKAYGVWIYMKFSSTLPPRQVQVQQLSFLVNQFEQNLNNDVEQTKKNQTFLYARPDYLTELRKVPK